MEPVVNKLQEGVKYPRFERDATKTINDLVEHITKERGVYSSSIEPNPSEHKVWFNTNNNTLNIYENSRWNTISGQGGGSGGSSGAIINSATINTSTISGGNINNTTISNSKFDGFINASGATISGATISVATINGANINGATLGGINVTSGSINYASINNATISGATIDGGILTGDVNASGAIINGATITGNTTINGATISGATISGCKINKGGQLNYGNGILVTYTGTETNPILIPYGGNIGYPTVSLTLCGVTLTGGDFTKLKNLQ